MRNFHFPGRSTVHGREAMVATSHPQASLTAVEVLREGGTAADAAIAACALLGVIEPQSTGIGGDCFALVQRNGEGAITAYNGSGRVPRAAEVGWYLERGIKAVVPTSAHAVSIPGNVDAWTRILSDHGRFGLERLLQPAVKAAEEGYVVAPRIAFDWHNEFAKLQQGVNSARYFLPEGRPPQTGDVVRQPELGRTLRMIAQGGRDAFYTGAVAEDMVATLRRCGGLHRLEDFATHHTAVTTAVSTAYKGYDVWQCPPNGPGIAMLVMLNILARFDLSDFDPLGVERFHLQAEASRIASLIRDQYLGDPAAMTIDPATLVAPDFVAGYASRISMDGMLDLPPAVAPVPPSTVYVAVVDKDRNVCSLISSIAHPFGSAIVSDNSGVLLHCRAAGFRIEPDHPNCIGGGKRPLHTTMPGLLTKDGRAVMVFGVMGGPYQIVGQSHVLTNILDYGCDVQEAIDMPRGLHYDGVYQLEDGVPEETVQGLTWLGHRTTGIAEPLGGGQAIWIDGERGTLTGGSDPRKDGCALGY